MTQPVKFEVKKPAQTENDTFDFPESSDMCDFGYALVHLDEDAASRPAK